MNLPGAIHYELVYTCDGEEEHEVREQALTLNDVGQFSFEDADECTRCKLDNKEFSRVTLDRIEITNPQD